MRLKPDLAGAHLGWGKALLKLDKLPEAEPHLQKAARLVPDNLEGHQALADLYSRQKRAFPLT